MIEVSAYPGARVSLIGVNEVHSSNVQLLDCRLPHSYAAGHIPGARHIDVRGLRHGPLAQLPAPDKLVRQFAGLGVDGNQTIVPYADRMTFSLAGYVWWVLRYAGYHDVRVLHGGIEAWTAAGFPLDKGENGQTPSLGEGPTVFRSSAPTNFPRPIDVTIVDAAWIVKHEHDVDIQLVDARTQEEFDTGHIPHQNKVYNISHDAVFDKSKGTLIAPKRLQNLFASIGQETTVITYCRSGVRSGTLLWAMAAAGYSSLSNYDGSLLDWQSRGLSLRRDNDDRPAH